MAKDPAFLFYPGDWQGGTMYLNHEQKGCYMDLLILQFNVGKFTLAQAKQVLSICFDLAWPMLQQKFKTDGQFFWNERLLIEIERRKNFTNSRRNNALKPKKQKKAYAKHMETENINETETVFKDWNLEKSLFLNAYEWKEKFCRDKNILMPQLEARMNEFINDIELREEYKPLKELKSHFTNTFNKQKNGRKIINSSDKHSGERILIESIKQDFRAGRKENPGT